MNGNVQDSTFTAISSLSSNQAKALNALLTTTSIEAASEQCGLHVTTIKKYLAQERFAQIYREQRALILQGIVSNLTNLGAKAIAKLEAALDAGDVNTELRAASRVLDYVIRSVELERRIRDQDEHGERIKRLEELEEERKEREQGSYYG